MVRIGLSDEQEALRASVREFASEVIAPQISELYEKSVFPVDIVRQMGRMGLFGLPFPEDVETDEHRVVPVGAEFEQDGARQRVHFGSARFAVGGHGPKPLWIGASAKRRRR